MPYNCEIRVKQHTGGEWVELISIIDEKETDTDAKNFIKDFIAAATVDPEKVIVKTGDPLIGHPFDLAVTDIINGPIKFETKISHFIR